MAITVNIIIKGVAICYKKKFGENELWRVLFPFDNENSSEERCHKLNFTLKKHDGPNLSILGAPQSPQKVISLARSRGLITITATEATGESGETKNFEDFVFDLTNRTNPKSTKPLTHENIILRNEPVDEWRKGTVLMKIDAPAVFSVEEYLNDLTVEEIKLQEDDMDGNAVNHNTAFLVMAHTIKATIELKGSLTVKDGADDLAVVSGSGVYTLVFDNDCKGKRVNRNDMDMFYEKSILDATHSKRQFRIGDRHEKTLSEIISIPASLADGKPCLSVIASISDNLPADAEA